MLKRHLNTYLNEPNEENSSNSALTPTDQVELPPLKKLKTEESQKLKTEEPQKTKKEKSNDFLKNIGYSGKKAVLNTSYTTLIAAIPNALDSIHKNSEMDINAAIESLNSSFVACKSALSSYLSCLNKVPSGKMHNYLKNKLIESINERITENSKKITDIQDIEHLINAQEKCADILRKIYSLKSELNKIEQSHLNRKKILQDLKSDATDPISKSKALLPLNNTLEKQLKLINILRHQIRLSYADLSLEKKFFDTEIISEYLNKSTEDSNDNQCKKLLTQLNLIHHLTIAHKNLPLQHKFRLSIERNLQLAQQNLLEQVGVLSPKTGKTSSLVKNSMFSNYMANIEERQKITTWNINKETDLQQYFLTEIFKPGKISKALANKPNSFNVSFLEYIEDGNYKILFAFSGTNDRLSDPWFTGGGGKWN